MILSLFSKATLSSIRRNLTVKIIEYERFQFADVNLALAIKNKYPEKKIGLLDTDPVDPTIPKILQLEKKIIKREGGFYRPIESFGIHCMFLPKEPKLYWAEEDIFDTIEELVREVAWEDIELLVVDAPSSSNCLHGVFQEQIPIDGSLLVTTGDSVALQMAKNTLDYYSGMKVPSAGIVVNLAQHKCPKCNHESAMFEKNQQQIEQILGQRVLQTFSMDSDIMKSLEAGHPFIQAYPKNINAKYFEKLACQVSQFLEKPIQITSIPDQTNQEQFRDIPAEDIPTINLTTEDILNIKK